MCPERVDPFDSSGEDCESDDCHRIVLEHVVVVGGEIGPSGERLHEFEWYKCQSNHDQMQGVGRHYCGCTDEFDPIILRFFLDPSVKSRNLVVENVPIVDRVCDNDSGKDFKRHDDCDVPVDDLFVIYVLGDLVCFAEEVVRRDTECN